MTITYRISSASIQQIYSLLKDCDKEFTPPLSSRVNLHEYSRKIFYKSISFEAWENNSLIGIINTYLNNTQDRIGYITNVCIQKKHGGKGIASKLLKLCLDYAQDLGFRKVKLEVSHDNLKAMRLYARIGFKSIEKSGDILLLEYDISMSSALRKNMKKTRDYDKEQKDTQDHKYAYDFDLQVMHPFMLRTFVPFFVKGNCLELGSNKGNFTRRLLPIFDSITCVEASIEAIDEARDAFGDRVTFYNSLFMDTVLPGYYDNIILSHVLEHQDEPVALLEKIGNEWLSEEGRLFIVCPNANAPSRQIAVKMGLISHNSAVTKAEAEHGHRITYSFDTLERDIKAGGLQILHRTGIFFKSLANYQWDKLLITDIISKEYLEGCYQLGHQYPELCSSIFVLCGKG